MISFMKADENGVISRDKNDPRESFKIDQYRQVPLLRLIGSK